MIEDARKPRKKDYKPSTGKRPESRAAKDKRERQHESAKARRISDDVTTQDLFHALTVRGAINFIKVQDLCSSMVAKFGGIDEFTTQFKSVFDNATSGFLKARMLEGILKMINQVHKEMGGLDPVDEMSDHDLQRELKENIAKFCREREEQQQELAGGEDEPARTDDGLGTPEVPGTTGGVGEAAVGSPEPVHAAPETPSVPRVDQENPPSDRREPLV
jgi:hypothetical protein